MDGIHRMKDITSPNFSAYHSEWFSKHLSSVYDKKTRKQISKFDLEDPEDRKKVDTSIQAVVSAAAELKAAKASGISNKIKAL